MHLANQISGKPDTLSQSSPSRQAIPEFNTGGTLDIRENREGEKERDNQRRGMLGLRNNQTVDNPCCRKLQSRHKA